MTLEMSKGVVMASLLSRLKTSIYNARNAEQIADTYNGIMPLDPPQDDLPQTPDLLEDEEDEWHH